jgi:hypothetical protein
VIYLAAICVALVALLAYRERGAALERRELYQRIQAPEMAVVGQVRESRPPRRKARPIAADDDAAFMERDGVKKDG